MNLASDRAQFLYELRTNPGAFVRHLPGLSAAVLNKLANRVRLAVRSPHTGAKHTTFWIDDKPGRDSLLGGGNTDLFLPKWGGFRVEKSLFQASVACRISPDTADAETLFEQNRWRFLYEFQLHLSSDWQKSLTVIRSWIAQNQSWNEEAWEPYSASERVANLLVWLSCVRNEFGDAMAEVEDLRLFVEKSLDWIGRHLEYYGEYSTNNHILNNARALVIGGVAVGNDRSYRAGMETFRQFLPRLIAKEGFLRERSSHYQMIITNWVLDACHFVEARYGDDAPDARFLKGYADRMTAAAAELCDEGGELLGCIGDISPDASPWLSSQRLAVLYPEFWPAEKKSKTECVTILDDWFRIDDGHQCVLGNFPPGNFPPNFPTHGHGDHTGFVWRVGNVAVLADSGRYRYTADGVSLMQKSALGHSIPLVNGFAPLCESLLRNGMWWPRPYAAAHLNLATDGEYVRMSHDGFARATPVQLHSRRVGMVAAGIEVEDQFDGTESVAIQLRWNFGPGFETFDTETFSITGADGEVRISVSGFDGKPKFRVLRADDSGGWFSDMYGVKSPSLVLDVEGRVSLAASIKTCFEIVHVRNSRNPEI
jgi:hypothetical protein